ncbi:hypothetical protein MTR67_031342 [Solanum verrucosum]|uniref:P-type ATPase A domain-containing protein n=1 Tax=Solanum verrucosum TaxID=315347 RepID=A0AAF0U291_SOLVR|nr:hypothetical protein MTR67_031342 [Solanum verrucosum]
MRMIEILSDHLRVDQAILTGESCSVEKELDATTATNAVYQDKTSILFSSLLVVGIDSSGGRWLIVVVEVVAAIETGVVAATMDKIIRMKEGTTVVAGRARAVVIGVGSNTAMGSIRDSMLMTEDEVTPLKKKLDEFGTFLAKASCCSPYPTFALNSQQFFHSERYDKRQVEKIEKQVHSCVATVQCEKEMSAELVLLVA